MLLKKELKTLYVMTLYLRLTELKMIELNQAGIVPGHIHSGLGQEGAYAGVLATRRDGDYCKFTHRAVPACHWAGVRSPKGALMTSIAACAAAKLGQTGSAPT